MRNTIFIFRTIKDHETHFGINYLFFESTEIDATTYKHFNY